MTYDGRVRVSYGSRLNKLERLRQIDAALEELHQRLAISEMGWDASPKTMDDLRTSCISVSAALGILAKGLGVSKYAVERINDLHVALGELEAGRTSALLSRADLPTRTPAASDLAQQGIAQVCVDFYRAAGLTAHEAHTRTARVFLQNGFRNFGVSKIKGLGVRLTGAGASQDPAFEFYSMGIRLARGILLDRGVAWPPSEEVAEAVTRRLVSMAKQKDHRLAA